MAAPRNRRQGGPVMDGIPECPICLEPLAAPIYQCMSGHDICDSCSQNLRPYICPTCRQPMTRSRNEALENFIRSAKVPCPNKDAGCVYVISAQGGEGHLKECIFRQYKCPLGLGYEFCSWTGKRADMMDHFENRHPSHCFVSPDTDIELNYVSLTENNSHLRLASLDRLLFMIHLKIDPAQNMAYFTVQHIGTKTVARQYNYKIEVTSQHESRRKVIFQEMCFNDTSSVEDIVSQRKCGVISLSALKQFVKDDQLSFRYLITKQVNEPAKRFDNEDGNSNNEDTGRSQGNYPQGPRSQSKGPENRGSEFKGAGQNRGRGNNYRGRMKTNKFAA